MMLTDTHCHLSHPDLYFRLPEITAQAAAVQVGGFIVPAAAPEDWQTVAAIAAQPAVRAVAYGVHPWYARQWNEQTTEQLQHYLHQNPQAWVGEIGLDYLHDTPRHIQAAAFAAQLDLAQHHRRPVIIHSVKAHTALLDSIRAQHFRCGGIVHAFSGSLEHARQWLQHGFKIGIGTLLLNPNAKKVHAAAAQLPEHAIVLETDSPFMQPHNTPANLHRIAAETARLRGISIAALAAVCERNLQQLLVQAA